MLKKKYILGNSIKTARLARLLAKLVDFLLVAILGLFLFPFGIPLGVIYLSFADSLYNGQSIGKKIMGFSVLSLEDGKPCRPKQSFIRNLPFIIPMLFAIIPFWGIIISVILFIPLILLELFLLSKLDSAHRLGDVLADTTVIANDQDRADITKKRQSWFEKQSHV
jgi:uncharacterized RDD family membrane protein YckC